MDTAAHEWPHKGILGVVESSERQLLLPEIQAAAAAAERRSVMRGPQKEHAINCPRCDSTNTKFCYYNNYSLSQPRYFCKTCRRYWTAGGTLRNVPVGGGSRKNKKSSSSSSSSSAANPRPSQHPIHLASYKLYHGAAAHDLSPTLAGPAQFVNPEPLSSPEPAGSLFGAAGFGFRELIMGPAAASSMKMHPLSGGLLFPFEDLKHVSMMNESDHKAAVVLQGSDPTFFWNGGAGGNGGGSW